MITCKTRILGTKSFQHICSGIEAERQLLYVLYTRDILNYKTMYVKKYKYNYSDKQTITFTDYTNKFEYIFENIPTNWGYLNIYQLEERS